MVPQPAVYPTIELSRGADFYDEITVYEDDQDTVVDLTNYTFRWQFRDGRNTTDTLLAELNVTLHCTLTVDMLLGVLKPLILGVKTNDFPDRVYHDLRVITPEGRRLYWFRGEIVMTGSVTVPAP